MAWLLLSFGVISELAGSLALRAAAHGRRAWFAVVVGSYGIALLAMSGALKLGMGIGIAYGVWAACGVALTAIACRLLFGEPLSFVMSLGIGLIAAGVLLVETGGA